jgi:hypothetical protein
MRDRAIWRTSSAQRPEEKKEQAEAVGCLEIDQRVDRVRVVIDRDACREVEFLREVESAPAFSFRHVQRRVVLERFERLDELFLDPPPFALVSNCFEARTADAEEVEHEAIATCVDIGAKNIQSRAGE